MSDTVKGYHFTLISNITLLKGNERKGKEENKLMFIETLKKNIGYPVINTFLVMEGLWLKFGTLHYAWFNSKHIYTVSFLHKAVVGKL